MSPSAVRLQFSLPASLKSTAKLASWHLGSPVLHQQGRTRQIALKVSSIRGAEGHTHWPGDKANLIQEVQSGGGDGDRFGHTRRTLNPRTQTHKAT